MRSDLHSDLGFELLDLCVQGPDHLHKAEYELAAGGELEVSDPGTWRAAELRHQRGRMLPARVWIARQKRLHPSGSQAAGVRRGGVALKEREQDLRVHMAEQPQRPGPEPLELGPELVDDPSARGDEILPRPGQRPDRL